MQPNMHDDAREADVSPPGQAVGFLVPIKRRSCQIGIGILRASPPYVVPTQGGARD